MPTSPITSSATDENPGSCVKRRGFTLLEILAVTAVMMLVIAVATVRMRPGGSAVRFENAVREYRNCALRARNAAREKGVRTLVCFDPDAGEFRIRFSEAESSAEDPLQINRLLPPAEVLSESFDAETVREITGAAAAADAEPSAPWRLSDGCRIEIDGAAPELETRCVLFDPRGGADGPGCILSMGGRRVRLTHSPLTGAMLAEEE